MRKFSLDSLRKNIFSFCAFVLLLMFSAASCEKPVTPKPTLETGTMTDQDGNIYKTVKIGNQWWMAENLKVKTYLNGDTILLQTTSADWQLNNPAYCLNGSNSFGFLYNAYVVNDARKIAPQGWHIPSDEEWKTLEMHLGMSRASADSISWRGGKEGDKLKIEKSSLENSTMFWEVGANNQFVVWPNNESGFTALPNACRLQNGSFGLGPKLTGFWWSSSANNGQNWYRYLDYNKSNIFRFYADNRCGFSVRCVKD